MYNLYAYFNYMTSTPKSYMHLHCPYLYWLVYIPVLPISSTYISPPVLLVLKNTLS